MRNYTNTLLFESALDSITESNALLKNTAYNLFNPTIKIVEEDCETLLGTLLPVAPDSLGSIEIETGLPITVARLNALSLLGKSQVRTRSTYSCISKGGVCKECLLGSRPRLTSSAVGDFVKISPELTVSTVQASLSTGDAVITLPYSPDQYDVLYLYNDGTLLATSAYSISGDTLTLVSPVGSDSFFNLKFLVVSNVAYYYWLTGTFSGSLIGIKELTSLPLPVKKSLMTSFVNEPDVESLRVQLVNNNDVSEEDFVQYIPNIKDPFEKAVFVITLGSIFLNS